jgi:hypothetical protein
MTTNLETLNLEPRNDVLNSCSFERACNLGDGGTGEDTPGRFTLSYAAKPRSRRLNSSFLGERCREKSIKIYYDQCPLPTQCERQEAKSTAHDPYLLFVP